MMRSRPQVNEEVIAHEDSDRFRRSPLRTARMLRHLERLLFQDEQDKPSYPMGEDLLELAARQGVASYLARRGSTSLRLQRFAEVRLMRERMWQTGLCGALDELLDVFSELGTPVVCLKGPMLAERIYRDPLERLSLDLDLLVAKSKLPAVVRATEALGYRLQSGVAREHHVKLIDPTSGRLVEIHDDASSDMGTSIPGDELVQRSTVYPSSLLGRPVRILSPEDELIFLSVHAVRHRLSRLLWVLDLRRFVDSHPGLDWKRIDSRSRHWGVRRALELALQSLSQHAWKRPLTIGTVGDLRLGFGSWLLDPQIRLLFWALPGGAFLHWRLFHLVLEDSLAKATVGSLRFLAGDLMRRRASKGSHPQAP